MFLVYLLLILMLSAETASLQAESLEFGCAVAIEADLSRASLVSPWDDEVEIPDEPEDEVPDDPGKAASCKAPRRDSFAAHRDAEVREVVATSSVLAAAPAPGSDGPSRTPITLCRLLF